MVPRNTLAASALALATLAGGASQATVLTLGAGWEPVVYIGSGSPIYDYFSGDTDFTFTVTNHADLKITDLYYNLDRFDLTINGVDQGETFFPLQDYAYTEDPDAAFADPHFSHAGYGVGPGTYTVTGLATNSPYGSGVAAIELAVPEPETWALMLIGLGAIGGVVRLRGRRAARPTA